MNLMRFRVSPVSDPAGAFLPLQSLTEPQKESHMGEGEKGGGYVEEKELCVFGRGGW